MHAFCALFIIYLLFLTSCLHRKTIEDEQPFYTTGPEHERLVSRREVCEQNGGL